MIFRIPIVSVAAGFAVLVIGSVAAESNPMVASMPALAGDGVTDDTVAIQARLDSGAACVVLPTPKKAYVISRTLKIGSNQELRLDRFSMIRLADGSNCPMLENRAYRGGRDGRLAVTGGIWDMNSLGQGPNPWHDPGLKEKIPKRHDPDFFIGIALRFNNVDDMSVRGLTIRNPVLYGLAFCQASNVTVDDIAFDYRVWRTKPLNLDGIHLDGCCRHFRITNLRGTCYDDMVALNANDEICAPTEGSISDVDIDGLYCDYGHSAVRLLSAGSDVRRVTVRNVHGRFYCYTIGLTHYFPDNPRGRFDDIVISDVFASKAIAPDGIDCAYRREMPLIQIEGPVDVGNLSVARVYRDEDAVGSPTIGLTAGMSSIESLSVRDCRMKNRLKEPIVFIQGRNLIANCVEENNTFIGAWERGCWFWNVFD